MTRMRRYLLPLMLLSVTAIATACSAAAPPPAPEAAPASSTTSDDNRGDEIEPLADWDALGSSEASEPEAPPVENPPAENPPAKLPPPPVPDPRTPPPVPEPEPELVCPIAVAGWTARDIQVTEIPDNVLKNLGIGTEYAVSATIVVSNQSDAPIKLHSLPLSTTVTTSDLTWRPMMYVDDLEVQAGETRKITVTSPLNVGTSESVSITSYGIDAAQESPLYGLVGDFDIRCETWGFPLQYVPSN